MSSNLYTFKLSVGDGYLASTSVKICRWYACFDWLFMMSSADACTEEIHGLHLSELLEYSSERMNYRSTIHE